MAAEGNTFVSEDSNFKYTVLTDASSNKNGTVSVQANLDTLSIVEIEDIVDPNTEFSYNSSFTILLPL